LRLFSFGGYGLALAALALVVFGAYDSYPSQSTLTIFALKSLFLNHFFLFISFIEGRKDNGYEETSHIVKPLFLRL